MTSRSNYSYHYDWANEILSESIREKRISYNNLTLDEVKSHVSGILIEAYIYISRSRFGSALSQLRQISIYKNEADESFLSSTGGRYESTIPSMDMPMEFWFLVYKATLKLRTLTECINYIRSMEYHERIDLIRSIYGLHGKAKDSNECISLLKYKAVKPLGLAVKKIKFFSISAKKLKISLKYVKNCIISRTKILLNKLNSRSFPEIKTSVLIPSKFKSKKTLMKVNLLVETIIFLCELGRGFDDLPIISYNKILIDKISVYKKTSPTQFKIMLTIAQYLSTKLSFYFTDYKSIAIGSDIKINLKNMNKINESKLLKRLEDYKQFFNIKQNFYHEDSNLLFCFLYLFRDVNFSNMFKKYSYKPYNESIPPKTRFYIFKLLLKCCTCAKGQKNLEYKKHSSTRLPLLQPNLADLFSDIFYLLDLIFEVSYMDVNVSSIMSILEWSFILILCTLPESTVLKNIIIRLTLFGINLSPLDNVESLNNLTDFIPEKYKEDFDETKLDILNLRPNLIFAHKITNNLHRFSSLNYILFDINSEESKSFLGFKIKCIEKMMKFILTNLKLGFETHLSEYEKLKNLIDFNDLVSLELLIVLSLIELISKRYALSYHYARLGLDRNELDTNCWRIIYILKWICKQQKEVIIFKFGKRKKRLKNDFKVRREGTKTCFYKLGNKPENLFFDAQDPPIYILKIKQLTALDLALRLEEKILAREWWFPWESKTSEVLAVNWEARQQQESLIMGNPNPFHEPKLKCSYERGMCKLLEKLLKDDQYGIENYLWVVTHLTPPFYKNEKSYKLFVALLALCQAGYAKTVIDVVGINTKGNPHMLYLLLYAQACITDSAYNGRLITRVKEASNEYPSIHTLTRLEARMHLSVGDFRRANRLFRRAREGYMLGAKREKYSRNFIPNIVHDVCVSHYVTVTDIMSERYCKKCVGAGRLC